MSTNKTSATEIVAQAIAESEGLPSYARARSVVQALTRAGLLFPDVASAATASNPTPPATSGANRNDGEAS